MPTSGESLIDKDKVLHEMICSNPLGTFFGISQSVLDTTWRRLTDFSGDSAVYISMEIGADLDVFNPVKDRLQQMKISDSTEADLNAFTQRVLHGQQKIPNYSGGLGILAGDTLKSFADCKIPVAAISLLYRKGYFSQLVDSRIGQIAWAREWEPVEVPGLYLLKNPGYPNRALQLEIPFFDSSNNPEMAYAQIWMKLEVNENLDSFVPVFLLDFGINDSPSWIREAANSLYDSSSERIKAIQRRMLGASVLPLMDLLGLTANTIHLNEQHGVVAVLHLIADYLLDKLGPWYETEATDEDIYEAADRVAKRVIYTIHTPVQAGHDRFDRTIYASLSHITCQRILNLLARDEYNPELYNFTAMAMRVNRAVNSVSRLHRDVTKQQFPHFADKITAITNGVHHLTWISDNKAEAFSSFPELENWRNDPSVFANAAQLLEHKKFRAYLEEAWRQDTEILISYVNDLLLTHRQQSQETWIDPPNYLSYLDEEEGRLRPEAFTIGFARRFSTYKRADLIFDDIDRLADIITSEGRPVNFLFAGKAHPSDEPGKSLIKIILDIQDDLYRKSHGLAKLVFIPDYDMAIAKMMVAGVHAWLNSPKRPLEASGTSGMKAAMNAVPNISIMDGWWVEGYHGGSTGWKFGFEAPLEMVTEVTEDPASLHYDKDSTSFYKLFPEILKEFHDPLLRPHYIDKCIMNLILNVPRFNTHRLVAEYTEKYDLKLPAGIEKRIKKFRDLYRSEAKE